MTPQNTFITTLSPSFNSNLDKAVFSGLLSLISVCFDKQAKKMVFYFLTLIPWLAGI